MNYDISPMHLSEMGQLSNLKASVKEPDAEDNAGDEEDSLAAA